MSYFYWNGFIDDWRKNVPTKNGNPCKGWSDPAAIPLMNSSLQNDCSWFYLPEPWWGNAGKEPLHAVVINYNPGIGGPLQHFKSSASLFGCAAYSDFANSEAHSRTNHFAGTNRWHRSRRGRRVFNTLHRIGIDTAGCNELNNHLSIELIPWHTKNTGLIHQYIMQNLKPIFDCCISFAAHESKRIANDKLRNKVILRLSGRYSLELLETFAASGLSGYKTLQPACYTPKGTGGYYKFSLDKLPGVEFISIWGTRNDFPCNIDMDWIFKNII